MSKRFRSCLRVKHLIVFFLSLACVVTLIVEAADGDLDSSFGRGGRVTTDFNNAHDQAKALALQTDGKIVVAGSAQGANGNNFALARLDSSGNLDSSFGSGGKVITDFTGRNEQALAMVLQSDGKVVVAGVATQSSGVEDFALARYTSSGNLDPSFCNGGTLTTNFNGSSAALAMALQSDGKIVVAGVATQSSGGDNFALARYTSSGSLDPSFGIGGKVTTDFNRGSDKVFAIALQNDGRILVAGLADGRDVGLARYDVGGNLDSSFGSNGKVTTDFNGRVDEALAMALQSDGKIVVAGTADQGISQESNFNYALARYDSRGSLDPSFGSGGKVTTDFSGDNDQATAMVLQSDGKIVVAGFAFQDGNSDFALVRYGSGGNLDSGFGSGGKVITDFNNAFDQAFAMALQNDGRIVVAGSAEQGTVTTNVNFALARYLSTPSFLQFTAATYSAGEASGPTPISVARIGASGGAASVQFATVAGGTATGGASCSAGVDYVSTSGTLNWVGGDASNKSFSITICDDSVFEGNETVNLALSNAGGAALGAPSTATLTINENDSQPTLSITDVIQAEGNSGTTPFGFTVSLSNPTTQTVTVNYATADGTATAGSDYEGIGVTGLTFTPGQTSKIITVLVNGDTANELNETFFINLSSAANASITDGQGQGTITNDDALPTLSINDVSVTEGNSGTVNAAFTVSLSPASGQTVTVNYATANGTATAGGDYQAISVTTLTFNPGITALPLNVQVVGDTLNEVNETFFVNLTNATNATIADSQGMGTILNDDPVPTGTLRISGRIVDDSARVISGLVVILGGAASGSLTTDSNGNYSFDNLSTGDYTVAPSGNYSFSPANHSFTNLSVDRIANFVGTQTVVSISGRVTDSNDIGLGSVTLNLTRNDIPVGTVSTDGLGNYSFDNLTAGSNYVVTPVGSFTASRLFFNRLSTNTTANFRGIPDIPAQCSTVSYESATNLAVGAGPISVKVGDLNNDSRLDLIAANFNSNNVSILLANSTGGFGPAANFAVGTAPSWVALGDFNGDNRLDLVTTNSLNVSILLGDGAGGFSAATNFGAGARPASVVVADFNGDGRSDLAVANQNSSNVSILSGDGTGGFGAATNLSVGTTPTSVALGDFNRDGRFDLVTANATATISVLLATGNGGFTTSTNFPVGTNAGRVVVADLNGDNRLDVIVTTPLTNSLSILLGDGNGSFGPATSFAVGAVPRGVALGDFNGDGRPDLVASNRDSNDVSILLGNGAGSFGPPASFAGGISPFSVSVGDFNNDGKQDLAVTNENSNSISTILNNGQTCNTQTSATISGRVVGADNNPLPNVTVTLSGPITRVVSTDSAGNYVFSNLTPGGNYAVTVQSNYFVFAPSRADFFNPGSSQTANFTAVPVVVPVPLPPPIDDFSGSVRDASRWSLGTVTQPPGSFDPQVDVSQVNGQLVISPLTQASGLHYSGYVSANSFDLRGGSISADLVRPASGGADTIFAIGSDSDNFFRFLVQTSGAPASLVNSATGVDGVRGSLDASVTQLIFQVNAGGQLTALSIDYDPILHKHLRFRHEALTNELVFETSPNNIDFTPQRRITLSRSVSALTAELSAGTSDPANPGSAAFESVSLVVSTFQFSSASYGVSEGAGSILITVTRAGSTGGTDAVDYATADGTATQATRYINAAGRLQFAAGETSKTFLVLIVDNALTEGDQNVNLVLQNPMNSGLNTPGRAVLTITDNDTTVATANPLDDPTFYVQQHYFDFLNRPADASGLAFWVNQITGCGSDPQCIELKRINVSAAYFLSIEFQETGFLAHRFYNLALNRPNGLPRYSEFFRDTQAIGLGVVIGTPGAEALLEANKVAYSNEFAARDEFTALYPLTQTPAEYVNALYAHAGITPTATEHQAAIDEFSNPTGARGRVLRRVADNAMLRTRETNRAFVLAQYFGYLRRNPDDAPDNNLDGYNFWLGKLNQFNGNFINAEMVKAFISSGEYRQRFGP